MLHKLLLLICIFSATNVMAQVGITPIKTSEKPADPQIDYKQSGAPMPPLRYLVYHDSSRKENMDAKTAKSDTSIIKTQTSSYITGETVISNDTVVTNKSHKKKRKKHHEDTGAESAAAGGDKQILTNEDFNNGANLFVMMFNPTCSHCQDETVLLGKNSNLFKRSKVVLLANPQMKQYLSDFIGYTHADQYSSFMYLGIDTSDFMKQVFLYQSLPQINIYDKNRKLIKTYTGEVAIDSLEKYIQ